MKIHSLCPLICRLSKREVRNKKADRLRKKSYQHPNWDLLYVQFPGPLC